MTMEAAKLRLVLVDTDPKVCAAFSAYFGSVRGVEIVNGPLEELRAFDCITMPGNSFGFVTGGVEAAILRFFGDHLIGRIRSRIHEQFSGEQPVGTSIIVPTGDEEFPFVAHTPLMRVPMPIAMTDNVYLAMWATLHAVRAHNRIVPEEQQIQRLVCPGFCTITGRVTPDEAARQMALAYKNFVEPPVRMDWNVAFDRQDTIGRGGDFPIMPPSGTLSRKKMPKM
jgi:O-acetyl-ADP-ribose deacetylase (regulator of RNase III)